MAPTEVAVVLSGPPGAGMRDEALDLRFCRGVVGPGEALAEAAARLASTAGLAADLAADLAGDRPWVVDLSGPVARFACDARTASAAGFRRTPTAAPPPARQDDADPGDADRQDDADPGDADRQDGADPGDAEHLRRVAEAAEATIGFRPLTRADFADAVRWTHEPHVARWWDDEASDVAAAERHYGPALDGTDPTRRWVVEVNGRSVGLVQDYRIGDHPEYALLTARPEAVGFDYLVGDPTWVGRGSGTRILWQFLRDVVGPGYPDAPTYFAAPDHRNAISLRVLDKLGFTRGLWFDEPQRDGSVATVVGCSLDVAAVFGTSHRHVTER